MMEMPKGWNKSRESIVDVCAEIDLRLILDLMKEMAEALHNIQTEDGKDLTDPKLEGVDIRYHARLALKKFQEWR